LFLCQTLPYPPDGGVWIRSYNVLRLLATQFEITLLCFERALSARDGFAFDLDASLTTLRQLADTSVFPIPQRTSRARFIWDHGRSLLRRRVFTEYLYESKAFRRRLGELLATQRFDIAHVDSLDLSGYLPLLKDLPVVLVHHNVESQLLRRRSTHAGALAGAYIAHQASLAEDAERHWCPRVSLNVVVSANDGEALQRIAPEGDFEVVPNGVDLDRFRPTGEATEGLVFVGGANWFPNRDAMEFFCDEILPLLKDEQSLRVKWVGAAPQRDRSLFAARGVEVTGYVDDIRPEVLRARCYIVPLRVGGGSRLKILDAWAMGKAVVSTSVGCEGLAAVHEENLLIADTPGDFAAAIRRVLQDETLRNKLGAGARATVEREYGWNTVGRRMIDHYLSLIRSSVASSSALSTSRDVVQSEDVTSV
jgi:glycosyltransferase involved in cell wall biosynthesis